MTPKESTVDQELHRRAVKKVEAPLEQNEMAKGRHELKVHQIEQELRNDELSPTRHELETSRARYFDLYNLAPVAYCLIDKQGLILEANITAATQFGVERGMLDQQPITSFIFPQDWDLFARTCQQIFATGTAQVCELRLHPLEAAPFWARLEGNLAHEADGSLLCRLVTSDITARKQMEDDLRQSEEKYRAVAHFTHDWEFWLGPEDNFLYCSPSCQRITGHSDAAFEKDPSLLRTLVHPDDLAAYDQHLQQEKELKILLEFEFRLKHADSAMGWRWIAHICQPVFDDKGQFLGTRGNNRDVTEHKYLEAEVAKATNLESLGLLAGGIAHDFNNLLQGLFGNIELAKIYTEESSKAYPYLGNATQAFQVATKLTAQLIAFSKGGNSNRADIAPAEHIKAEVVSSLAGSGRVAEFDLADDLWMINFDPFQFHQIIKLIVLNAKEAMTPGSKGKLKIKAVNEPLLNASGKSLTLAPGYCVRVSIQDQGCGISKEHLPRIFDPYFSTKQQGAEKGMGLGLSLCDAIIRKHGGATTVQSKLGKGTTFHIYLPAVEPAANKAAATKDLVALGPRILLMDDDPGVVQVTTEVLRVSGFRVDSSPDGETAIEAYQEACTVGDPYAVVILDLMIPGGMGGKEAIAKLKEIDREVKAIVSSGYSSDDVMTNFADYGFVAACAKPYHAAEMMAILARIGLRERDQGVLEMINPLQESVARI